MTPADLEHEVCIVWETDPEQFSYVRQTLIETSRRAGRPRRTCGRLIGYAELALAAPAVSQSDRFLRRVFYLMPHDRGELHDAGIYAMNPPLEGVDPHTVVVRIPGSTVRS
ncbi:transcription factor [Streptomyces sp. SID14478]|uniref:DUF6009 family protein n=1 Tax=Streptomyces sp. SID14478 TaxID=2706073 RepID=UPI0013D9AB0D|nr:DUF6009 family protein [Streptomyces sp. SID14478]NEB77352.1 transcription factor [Streptomyces sp. SID14478]